MNYTLLVLLISIILLISIFGVLIYGYSFYYKHLYYKTFKYRLYSIWPLCLLSLIFFALTVTSLIYQFDFKNQFFIDNQFILSLSVVAFVESTIIVVLAFFLKKKAIVKEHEIKNFWTEDFENQLIAINTYKKKSLYEKRLNKYHSSYYKRMKDEYLEISKLIENKTSFDQLMIRLLDFDEKFKPKFTYGYYIVQIDLFLNLCIKVRNTYISK